MGAVSTTSSVASAVSTCGSATDSPDVMKPWKNSKERRAERRAHLQWDKQLHATQDMVSTASEVSTAASISDESPSMCEAMEGHVASATDMNAVPQKACEGVCWWRTSARPFNAGLTEEEKARVVIRNTFLDIDEHRVETSQRRRSAPFALSLSEWAPGTCCQQGSEESGEDDNESLCSTEISSESDPIKHTGFDDDEDWDQVCVVVRNTFLDVHVPKVECPGCKSAPVPFL